LAGDETKEMEMSKRGLLGATMAAATAAAAMAVALGQAATPAAKPSTFDRHFLGTAAQSDRFELASAALALRRAKSDVVCNLAQRLLTDHRRSSLELTTIAVSLHVKLPPAASPLQQWAILELAAAPLTTTGGMTSPATPPARMFNAIFAGLQVAAHQHAILDFAEAARAADDASVRSFAKRSLPVLRAHERMAAAAARTSGKKTNAGVAAACKR
jgi:putative membrane protein